jgi:hypothetical protein
MVRSPHRSKDFGGAGPRIVEFQRACVKAGQNFTQYQHVSHLFRHICGAPLPRYCLVYATVFGDLVWCLRYSILSRAVINSVHSTWDVWRRK